MADEAPVYFAHETAVIDEDCIIGVGTKIWHFTHIMTGSQIGEGCNIGQNVLVAPQVIVGNGVKIQNNVSLYTGLVCEDDVFLGPSVVFTNIKNPRSAISRKTKYQKTLVKKGATLGANSTILCGITLGAYSFVGAGAVVTKDIPDFGLVVGNPARHIGWISEVGARLELNEKGLGVCPETGHHYRLKGDILTKEE